VKEELCQDCEQKPCLGEGTLAKVYKCWIEGAPNMLSNVQYVCKEPEVDYETAMTLQNNENINLNIDHSRVIKIIRFYTPMLDIIKKPLCFMHYWNLDPLLKMTHMDTKVFQQLLKDQFMVQSQEKKVGFLLELGFLWLCQ
jgi:hypothetical protein